MNLDIIIPVHNDENTITDLYNKINDEIIVEKYNVIFIDDGSNDKTLDKLTKLSENKKQGSSKLKNPYLYNKN